MSILNAESSVSAISTQSAYNNACTNVNDTTNPYSEIHSYTDGGINLVTAQVLLEHDIIIYTIENYNVVAHSSLPKAANYIFHHKKDAIRKLTSLVTYEYTTAKQKVEAYDKVKLQYPEYFI